MLPFGPNIEFVMAKEKETPPVIDERLEFRGVSYLRELNAFTLGKLEKVIVFQESDARRLAVLIPYEQYLVLQAAAVGK